MRIILVIFQRPFVGFNNAYRVHSAEVRHQTMPAINDGHLPVPEPLLKVSPRFTAEFDPAITKCPLGTETLSGLSLFPKWVKVGGCSLRRLGEIRIVRTDSLLSTDKGPKLTES